MRGWSLAHSDAAVAAGLMKSSASVQKVGDVPVPNQCFKLGARGGIAIKRDARVDASTTDHGCRDGEIAIAWIGRRTDIGLMDALTRHLADRPYIGWARWQGD